MIFSEAYPMIKRSVTLVAGFAFVIGGLIVTPLPIPLGLIMVIFGLSLLIPSLPVLRRWLQLLRMRYPKVSARLRHIHPHLPAFARRVVDDTEPDESQRDADNK